MLPAPSANFTLPSLYDELELDCRLYFPRLRSQSKSQPDTAPVSGFAIFAHPYAPLGGSYDDPVVHSVGSLLISQGLVLATFNFRGAEDSAGKTSWSGKAELGDYVSLYAFIVALINSEGVIGWTRMCDTADDDLRPPFLLLGGYSYGSMITAHLPPISTVVRILQYATPGSAECEIKTRAHEMARSFLGYCETRQQRGRLNNDNNQSGALSPASATFGGYNSLNAAHRKGRQGASPGFDKERVRRSIDHVRRKLGSRDHDHKEDEQLDPRPGSVESDTVPVTPRQAYLLISPLLGAVSGFATVFSHLRFERKDKSSTAARDSAIVETDDLLTSNPSLIVFGSHDHFTSSRKVRDWCTALKAKNSSLLQSHEVVSASHFWHSADAEAELIATVSSWLNDTLG